MSYVIKRATSYPFTVHVALPGDGPAQPQALAATFKYLTRDELDALDRADPVAILNEVFIGADGLVDETGNPVTFTDDVKASILQDPLTFTALYVGFWSSTREAVAKN